MILLPTFSPCVIADGVLRIDRKFHTGTCLYAESLDAEIVVLAPILGDGDRQMDFIEVPLDQVPYRVETVRCDGNFEPLGTDVDRVAGLVREAGLLYGTGFGTEQHARSLGKTFIPIVEYNLCTQIEVARLPVSGFPRRGVRTVRTLLRTAREVLTLRAAHSIHCNGYPIYDQTRRFHKKCLLYLDSRMGREMVIDASRLEARIASLEGGRRPRLLYSGRYETMKGAMDVVEVGVFLFGEGVDFELDLYGKGDQAEAMRARVEEAGASECIRVHDAIPYPELVERSHDSDLFVCCHVQDDPSCTYLESCGSGLPIAGYGNAMWRPFAAAAHNGLVTPMGKPAALASAIKVLLANREQLAVWARKSRAFALEHAFEAEFEKRISALRPHL